MTGTKVESFDNTDSDGTAFTTQPFAIDEDIDTVVSWLAIVDNAWDVNVDVTVQLTTADDPEFNKYITDAGIAEGVTVTSGSRDGFGDADNEPFSYIRFEVTPAADPTTGTLEITWQRRRTVGD